MRQILVAGILAALLAGCGTTTSETYSRDPMPEIGNYPAPPAGYAKVRAAVVPFQDKTASRWQYERPIGAQAGEQFETLVVRSNRFSMIERLQLENLLKEQGLGGVVDPAEIAKPGRVRGIDYLFAGAITNFRVKVTKQKTAGGIFDSILGNMAPLDIDTSKTVVETQVGVDVKLVNTTSGEIVAKDFGEVKREDVASAWGVRVLGIGGDAKNELRIDADSQGKILRWALDESYKKMLPMIDGKFSGPQVSYCQKCKVEMAAGAKFCQKCGAVSGKITCKCGAELESGSRFCPKCGAKVEGVPEPAARPGSGAGPGSGPASAAADYMDPSYVLAQDHTWWYASLVKTQASGEKKEAEFLNVASNKAFWSAKFTRTRPARLEDIKVGATIYVPNVNFHNESFKTIGAVTKVWKSEYTHWHEATVTGLQGIEGGILQAPVDGSKDIHVSNVRVPVK